MKGRVYSIGGFKHGQHERHLQHAYETFCAWSAMSISVVLAEFPDWDILSSFDVFWIPDLPTSEQIRLHLQRIAQFYTIDFSELIVQHQKLLPLVNAIYSSNPDTKVASIWQEVTGCDVMQLRDVITKYVTAGGTTTSGIEHAHNTQDWLFTRRRGRLLNSNEVTEMKLVHDFDQSEELGTIHGARIIWAKLHLGHRHRRKPNKNKGRRVGPTSGNTFANMDRCREKAVKDALCMEGGGSKMLQEVQRAAAVQSASVWTDAMTNELEFNRVTNFDNRMSALTSRELLPHEFTNDAVDDDVKVLQHKLKLKEDRCRKASKKCTHGKSEGFAYWVRLSTTHYEGFGRCGCATYHC